MDYKSMNLEDIIAWCKKNNQVAWLKKAAAKKVDVKIYPKIKNEEGKLVADKTQKPTSKKRPISFIQLKNEFVDEFMPEIRPKSVEKKTMYDIIAEL